MCVHWAKMYFKTLGKPCSSTLPRSTRSWGEQVRWQSQQGGGRWVLAVLGGSFLFPGSGKSLPRGGEWLRWPWNKAVNQPSVWEPLWRAISGVFFISFLAFSLVQLFLPTSHSAVWFLFLKRCREWGWLRPASCAMQVTSAAEEASESCCRVSGKFCRVALLGSWHNQSWPPPFSNCWKVVGMSFPKWGTCFRSNPGLRINRLGFF